MIPQESKPTLDLKTLVKEWKQSRRLIAYCVLAVGILSSLLIVCIPRTYVSKVVLAPESTKMPMGGGLAGMAASFGINIDEFSGEDAYYPTLYPDIMESNDFIVSLFSIGVVNEDGDINTDYYTYLTKHQKAAFWSKGIIATKRFIAKMLGSKRKPGAGTPGHPDPFMLSQDEDEVAKGVRASITCEIDKKTDVITITVEDQDRLICATMADSVRVKLQDFITEYRTRKTRLDLEHYQKLTAEAYKAYTKASVTYASYSDSHFQSMLASSNVTETGLENEMQRAYDSYTLFSKQTKVLEAKVQERTPAFVVLQNASVPIKPAKPKRMIFVLEMMVLAFFGASVYSIRVHIPRITRLFFFGR